MTTEEAKQERQAVKERLDALTQLVRVRLNALIASIAVLFLVAIGGGIYVYHQAQVNHDALCAFEGNLENRITQSENFIQSHPNGFDGISVDAIQIGIDQDKATAAALTRSGLNCN